MAGLARRLAIGLVGQGVWRLAMALNPILLVPVQISHWGVDLFGQWVTLVALTSYLAYVNLGLVATATNDLIMAVAAGDRDRARRSFQMSCNLALIALPLILVVVMIALAALPLSRWFHLDGIGAGAVVVVFACAAAQLCFETLRGLMAAVLYANGKYGAAYNIATAIKLTELAAAIIAIAGFGAQPVHVAGLTATTALIDLAVVIVVARRLAPWARVDLRIFDIGWLREQLQPALGFSGYNFATQGVMIQGPRLVLGALLGGPAVAVYAVYATAMRLVDQLFLTVMAPAGVEISHAAGRKDSAQLVRLIAFVAQLSLLAFAAVSLALMILGPLIFDGWTRHQIAFHHELMILYLLMSGAGLPGRIAAQALISVNAMRKVAIITLATAAASIALGAALVPVAGLPGVLIGGIIGEAAISLLLWRALQGWLALPFRDIMSEMTDLAGSFTRLRRQAATVLGRR
ncbi:lipopolysaccharide biosynthesis protein [Bradyrhizobium sp. HKCCYLR20261]|uniref:lipopolysaccharide biosynthesis protein n=1 Tax=Bradyrhizobium sp. HKCCYLR20261 TaxID=3420760 RepID=UPI003EB7CB97